MVGVAVFLKMPERYPGKNLLVLYSKSDAAHVMPPFAGIGVNICLLDALYLAENLIGGNSKVSMKPYKIMKSKCSDTSQKPKRIQQKQEYIRTKT